MAESLLCYLQDSPYDTPAIVMNISEPTKRYVRETHQPKSSTYARFPHETRPPGDKDKTSVKELTGFPAAPKKCI